MKFQFKKAETSVILIVFIQDSSLTTGAGLGSLDQTSSITGGYVKRNGTGVALAVDEDVTTEGTYQAPSTSAKVRIGTPANMPTGFYELHFHNDLFTTADYLTIGLGGASNMAPLNIEIQLTDIDLNTALSSSTIGTATNLGANAVDSTSIADNAITAAKLNADCITNAKIADDAIAAENLATNSITTDALADNTITAAKIASNAITAAKIASDAITAAKLATDCITSDELAASAITEIAAGVLTSTLTEAYAADGAEFTLSQALYMLWSIAAELEDVNTTTPDSKKLDGSTVAMTFTLDNAATPTNMTRSA